MTVIISATHIKRMPEDGFDYCGDLRNELEWNPRVESMEKLTDGPVGVGTRYRAKWKQSKLIDVECTAYDRPHTWTYLPGELRHQRDTREPGPGPRSAQHGGDAAVGRVGAHGGVLRRGDRARLRRPDGTIAAACASGDEAAIAALYASHDLAVPSDLL